MHVCALAASSISINNQGRRNRSGQSGESRTTFYSDPTLIGNGRCAVKVVDRQIYAKTLCLAKNNTSGGQ